MNILKLKKAVFLITIVLSLSATVAFATPSAREVREYDGAYPDEDEQAFLQDSTEWHGMAWLKCIDHNVDWDWQGTNLDHFGNESSTVRLTDCEFGLYNDFEPSFIKVAVELVDDEDSQKPALFARELRQGTYTFEKIKGDGTLRAQTTDQYSAAAIVLKNYDQFEGSIDAGCAVVFGDVEDPERSDTGRIVIPEGQTVTIAEGKHFTAQELKIDGTLIMNGALNVSTVSGSGTVVLPAEIDDRMDISSYVCDESTIRFSNDFTGYFTAGHYFRGNLDLGGNMITLTGGENTEPYVINRLAGTGILNIEEESQPVTITQVLDAYLTIAYEGRIIGATSKVTLPEGFTLDSRGYIVKEGTDHHYVTVPKTVSGVYVPVVTDVTKNVELEEVEEENYEFYVYRVPTGDVITVDITAPYSNVVMTSEAHFEKVVNEDIDLPLPTGYAAGFLGLKTRGEFVHEIWYDENWVSPTDDAMPYPPPVPVAGYCSAVHNGNFVGRNFDYFVNDMPTFVVHVAGIEGERFASVGIGSAQLHNADVADYTAEYSLPPLGIFDGINENGVVIEENVVPFDVSGDLSEGTNPGKSDLHIVYVPRYVLDHATSAAHAIKLLEERNLVGDLLGAYSFHYLIADKDESYVVEFIDSKLVWRKMDISTNFNLCWDNENHAAITDETEGAWTKNDYPAPYAEETTIGDIKKYYTDYAMGVERFVTLREHYDEGNTLEGMMNLMKRVQYSQTYSIETAEENYTKGPSWWVSESCFEDFPFPTYVTNDGKEIDVDRSLPQLYELFKSDNEYFAEIIDAYDMAWGREVLANVDKYRYDYTGIWYTTHTAVYDIANCSLNLWVQEDYETPYDFKIPHSGRVEKAGLAVEDGQVVYKATASSMPTKTYQLKRTQDLTTPIANWETIATVTADDAEIMLLDQNPPERQAFYTVVETVEK